MGNETFKEKSPADFFYENMDVCGFDNPGRALYTAVRELVENSLDACETAGYLPDIKVKLEEEEKNMFKIVVEDNGPGIPPENIPESFGKVFYSSKYMMKQHRGRFGMGGTMAVMYGQITTQKPVHVVSITKDYITDLKIKIDILNNLPVTEPRNLEEAVELNNTNKHGTIIELWIEGNYKRSRDKIIEYIKQTAMVAPYATIEFIEPDGNRIIYGRVTKEVPSTPKESKPHPKGANFELFNRLCRRRERDKVINFLRKEFQALGKKTSLKILEMAKVDPNKRVKELSEGEKRRIVKGLRNFEGIKPPDASSLAPIGVETFVMGIKRVLEPEFVTATQRPPKAYEGHPFIVEVALAWGGKIPVNEEIKLYRFANRIPLLYDEWNDVSTRVIKKINWKRYDVKTNSPLAVFVHICSTSVPYKTLGKEYIANKPEIRREIHLGILKVCKELQNFLHKKEAKERKMKAFKLFSKHAELVSRFIAETVKGVDEEKVRREFLNFVSEKISGGGFT